jgi:NAD(P) transhydrogenase subunit alpha
MSLTNALDGIAVVGAIILAGEHKSQLATILGTIAIVAATSNIVGGFIITDRMLKMFKASKAPKRGPISWVVSSSLKSSTSLPSRSSFFRSSG